MNDSDKGTVEATKSISKLNLAQQTTFREKWLEIVAQADLSNHSQAAAAPPLDPPTKLDSLTWLSPATNEHKGQLFGIIAEELASALHVKLESLHD